MIMDELDVGQQKERASRALGALAQSLRSSGQRLRDEQEQGLGGFAEQMADRAEQLADQVRGARLVELVNRAEDFARREPALFLAGAFVAGALTARLLKSSRRGGGHDVSARPEPSRLRADAPLERDVTDTLHAPADTTLRAAPDQPTM